MDQQNPLAFSNPIYGRINYRPIPKPRLSKKQSNQTKNQQNSDDNNDNDSSPVQEKQSSILHDVNQQYRSSSLCLSDIRMTQLLEEINTLTDSLQKNFKSLPENVDNNNNNTNNNDDLKSNEITTTSSTTHTSYNDEIQRRTIIKRKKIPVRSDLFNISFNNNDNANSLDDNVNTTNLILPSTLTSITDVLNSETDKPITSSGDSGVFLMASQKLVSDNDENVNRENLENKSKIDKIATTIKEEVESETKSKQIAIDEPPKLPPRKPSRSGKNFLLSFY